MQNAARHMTRRLSLAAALFAAITITASAQPETSASCAATIRAVMADIAARDLATNGAPPPNAFLTLNPSAVGAGFVPVAVGSDNCGSLPIPAVYNGAVSLRATYGRFDTAGIFPIGFVNGVPGVIARDSAMLNRALAIAGDGWRAANAEPTTFRGKRIGVLRRFRNDDPWSGGDRDTQKKFAATIALLRDAGAEIVDDIAIDDVDPRLGPEYLKGFARRVDAAFASYPAV